MFPRNLPYADEAAMIAEVASCMDLGTRAGRVAIWGVMCNKSKRRYCELRNGFCENGMSSRAANEEAAFQLIEELESDGDGW